jgi:hypothetical protein
VININGRRLPMDYPTTVTLIVAAVSAVIATAYGALPERIDLTFVFAAYGAGAIAGDLVGARTGRASAQLGRRWGVLFMVPAALLLVFGLIFGW